MQRRKVFKIFCKYIYIFKEFSKGKKKKKKKEKNFQIKIKKFLEKKLKRKIQKEDKRLFTKPWYTLNSGPIQKKKKKIQIKRAQDHEYTIDLGGRYWAIKS